MNLPVEPLQPPVGNIRSFRRVVGGILIAGVLGSGIAYWKHWNNPGQKLKRAEYYYLRGEVSKAYELRCEAAWAGDLRAMEILQLHDHNERGAAITFARFWGRQLSERGDFYGSQELSSEYGTWSWNYWMTSTFWEKFYKDLENNQERYPPPDFPLVPVRHGGKCAAIKEFAFPNFAYVPWGLAFDHKGYLWVTATHHRGIFVFDTQKSKFLKKAPYPEVDHQLAISQELFDVCGTWNYGLIYHPSGYLISTFPGSDNPSSVEITSLLKT